MRNVLSFASLGKIFLFVLLLGGLLVSGALGTGTAFAQTRDQVIASCESNPAPCRSFDPAVNPVLLFEKATFAGGWSNSRAPSETDEGQCKVYVAGGNTASGCLKDNEFTFNGVVAAAGAGEQTTTEVAQNSNGQTTTEQTTGNGVSGLASATVGAIADTANTLVVKPIIMFILTFAGWMLGIAGVFFNQVLIKTVFQFSTYFGSSEGLLTAWGVMRDVANIGLLFGFIFMGVMLILNVDGGGHGHGHGGGISAKRAIPRLIIFAVLLNFSLFASQAIIDVSNAFASTFTTLAGAACDESAATAGANGDNACANVGISGKVMQLAGISTIWNDGILKGFETSTVTLLGLTVFVTITMVVLLAAGLMLVYRVVVLTMLMVTSPVGFAGMVIPGLQGLASKWWHALISQSFFAPVMLLLVFISLKMAESLNPNGAPLVDAFAEANSTMAGNLEVLVVFAVVIGLMISSLIVASKMGAMGASFATNAASAVTYGTLARGTNFVAGGAARNVRTRIQSSSFGNTAAGRVLVNRALRPIENANLDLRRAGVGAILGAAGATAGAKPAEHATYGDIAHQFSDIRAGKGSAKLTAQYEEERVKEGIDRSHGNLSAEQTAAIKKLGASDLAKLHVIQEGLTGAVGALESGQFDKLMKEKDLLTDDQKGALKKGRVESIVAKAATMTADQFEAATKSDAFNGADKEQMKNARFQGLTAALSANDSAAIASLVKNLSKKDLEQVPTAAVLTQAFTDALSDKQREDLVSSSNRNAAEKDAVRGSYVFAKINNEFKQAGGGEPAAATAASKISGLTPQQAAKLDAAILVHPQASAALTPAILAKILDENKLTAAQMKQIGDNIRGNSTIMSNPQVAAYMDGPAGSMW